MGQKVNPKAFRLGILNTWSSQWFSKNKYRAFLRQDVELRDYILKNLKQAAIEKVSIERSPNLINIIIHTARPGIIIGRGGEGIESLKRALKKRLKQDIRLEVQEIRNPDASAKLVAQSVAEQLEKRISFRRILKQTIDRVSQNKEVQGVKIAVAGRLDGSEMSRREWLSKGKIPLHTLRADVDFDKAEAHTSYGAIGVKVWIYKGEIFEKENTQRQ
ncbi:MAG: 30S ribosomal protein S3 [bacterium]